MLNCTFQILSNFNSSDIVHALNWLLDTYLNMYEIYTHNKVRISIVYHR